jgi:2-phosphosulfolactate phosphatase
VPNVHFIEGEEGCAYAREHGCDAVVVDALRASATAASMLYHGARGILVTREVEEAFAARAANPAALLYGERGGLPPEGFDHGNSPAEGRHADGHDVIFTTTNGAARMVQSWGASGIFMGTSVNASALTRVLHQRHRDVVLIPAGLVTDPDYDAQEDRAAAAYIALRLGWPLGEGAAACRAWQGRVQEEGLDALFATAPHGDALRQIGMEDDIRRCAAIDTHPAVPMAVERTPHGVLLRSA